VSVEEREGTLDRVNDKGILLSGARLSYSKWFEGDRPTEDQVGCTIRVVVDAGEKVSFLKKVLHIGDRAPGWKPPENSEKNSWGGGGRRLSPEELGLKQDEGTRIARSVAIDRAISMVDKGIPLQKVADLALALEAYILKGELPRGANAPEPEVPEKKGPVNPASQSPAKSVSIANPERPRPPASAKEAAPPVSAKPHRLAAKLVNALFNEALRGGLVDDWSDYVAYAEDVLKVQIKNVYQLDVPAFARVETLIRSKLGHVKVA
jgi:hypothetical protein